MLSDPPRDVAKGWEAGYLDVHEQTRACSPKRNEPRELGLHSSRRGVDDADEPEDLVVLRCLAPQLLKLVVELRELLHELVARANIGQLSGDERRRAHACVPIRQRGLQRRQESREDCQLACNVRAIQIVRRMRLLCAKDEEE
jgi:hypothetical protein